MTDSPALRALQEPTLSGAVSEMPTASMDNDPLSIASGPSEAATSPVPPGPELNPLASQEKDLIRILGANRRKPPLDTQDLVDMKKEGESGDR